MASRPKGGLGRGLNSLIPQAEEPVHTESTVSIEQITSNPYQPRSSTDSAQMESLAGSVREHGVLQPLLVQRDGDGFRLIAGHRRLEAARLAGVEQVPIIVREPGPDENILLLALVENLQRADLSPLDEAAAFRELSRRFGLSTEEIAARTGKNRSTIANSLRLLDLSGDVKELLEAGRITEGHARALLALKDAQTQLKAARTVIDRELNVRQTEALVKQLLGERSVSRKRPTDPAILDMEQRFRDALGTKVSLSGSSRKGKLTIHFFSEEELETLYDAIVRER